MSLSQWDSHMLGRLRICPLGKIFWNIGYVCIYINILYTYTLHTLYIYRDQPVVLHSAHPRFVILPMIQSDGFGGGFWAGEIPKVTIFSLFKSIQIHWTVSAEPHFWLVKNVTLCHFTTFLLVIKYHVCWYPNFNLLTAADWVHALALHGPNKPKWSSSVVAFFRRELFQMFSWNISALSLRKNMNGATWWLSKTGIIGSPPVLIHLFSWIFPWIRPAIGAQPIRKSPRKSLGEPKNIMLLRLVRALKAFRAMRMVRTGRDRLMMLGKSMGNHRVSIFSTKHSHTNNDGLSNVIYICICIVYEYEY